MLVLVLCLSLVLDLVGILISHGWYCRLCVLTPFRHRIADPENWMVYRVWWGRKKSMAGDLDGVAGVNIYSAVHPVSRRHLFPSFLNVHCDNARCGIILSSYFM